MIAITPTPNNETPKLPPECIEMILSYLWDDPSTLHQLLLCNRTLFDLIIPILYKSPFNLIANYKTWSDNSKSQRTAYLIRLLYACSIANREEQVPLSSENAIQSSQSTHDGLFKGPIQWPELPSPLTTDYLFYYTHQSLIPKLFKAYQVLMPSFGGNRRNVSELAIAQASTALTLALFGHSPSRIQTLSMTAHQLGYILFDEPEQGISWKNGVGLSSLRLLRRLELDITLIHTSTSWRNARRPPISQTLTVSGEENPQGWASNPNPTRFVDFPLIFIKEHQRLFRQSSPNHVIDNNYQQIQAPPVLQELVIRGNDHEWTPIQLLSQIEPLELVDLSAWNADIPELDQIPNQRLKSLRTNLARRRDIVSVPVAFLRRCSQMEEIWMPTSDSRTFQWAIDLQRSIGDFVGETRLLRRRQGRVDPHNGFATTQDEEMTQSNQDTITTAPITAPFNSSISQSQEDSLSLLPNPPLTKIYLYGGPRELVTSLEDALDAFRDNIKELAGFEDGYSRREEYPHMQITWLIPNLTYLNLTGRFVFFFDLRSLRHCPNLRTLKLHIESNIAAPHRRRGNVDVNDDSQDGQDAQDGEDPVWMTGRDYSVLANMSRLEKLQLGGTSWNINNTTLQILGGFPLEATDHPIYPNDVNMNDVEAETYKVERSTPLAASLQYFAIEEAHKPTRAGLVPFVKTMKNLKMISLGRKYSYAVTSLEEAAGPRLTVEYGFPQVW
ncbi:hypothetical protein FBU30_010892 [Linnemannia zychae]|nr:hypothetical protein FBU30_010892 [Linnemannia zychae]